MAGAIETVHGDVERIVHHIIELPIAWMHHRTRTLFSGNVGTLVNAIRSLYAALFNHRPVPLAQRLVPCIRSRPVACDPILAMDKLPPKRKL